MGMQLSWETREEGSKEEEARKVNRPMMRKETHTRIPVMINRGLLKQKAEKDEENNE